MISRMKRYVVIVFIVGCVCFETTGCSALSIEVSKSDDITIVETDTILANSEQDTKEITQFRSPDGKYSMEMDFSNLSAKFEPLKSEGEFWYQCTDTNTGIQMFVKLEFISEYRSTKDYYDSIVKQCEGQKMIVEPNEILITVKGDKDTMINYFMDSNHSSGSWDHYSMIDDTTGLLIQCYGINEHQPGDKDLAEKIIDSIISNSVISSNK